MSEKQPPPIHSADIQEPMRPFMKSIVDLPTDPPSEPEGYIAELITSADIERNRRQYEKGDTE